MNDDLISREALKKQLKAKIDLDQDDEFNRGYNIGISACVEVIDNAPTVKFSLLPADETKEEAYKRGYEKGKVEGILKGNERLQGDLADKVWKLYEKYQPHLATRVIEFGDELKELLIKYMKGGAV